MIQYNGMKSQVRGGFVRQLPAGPYVAKVLSVQVEGKSPAQRLEVYLDIAEGEFKDFWMKKYKAQKEKETPDRKVSYKGIMRVWIPNEQNKSRDFDKDVISFNDMIGRFVASNPGFEWDGEETKLAGKLIGISVQEDSFNGYQFTRPVRFEIVDDVRSGKVATLPPKQQDDQPDPTPAPAVDQRSGMQMVNTEQLPWDQPW